MATKTQSKKPGKQSGDPPESLVIGAKEIEGLPGHFSSKITKLIERNAFAMVKNAVEKANAGDYRAMKYLFDLLERFESLVPQQRGSSMARVLLRHLGLTEEMIANEQAAAEAEEEDWPTQESEGNRLE
jgi:hypothetical protein